MAKRKPLVLVGGGMQQLAAGDTVDGTTLRGSRTFSNQTLATVGTTVTITVTGAAVGSPVVVSPRAALQAGLSLYGWVSAANTVSVSFDNRTLVNMSFTGTLDVAVIP